MTLEVSEATWLVVPQMMLVPQTTLKPAFVLVPQQTLSPQIMDVPFTKTLVPQMIELSHMIDVPHVEPDAVTR